VPRGAGSFFYPSKPRCVTQEAFFTRQNRAAWRRKLFSPDKIVPHGAGSFCPNKKSSPAVEEPFCGSQAAGKDLLFWSC
jgi:hypothetical protein